MIYGIEYGILCGIMDVLTKVTLNLPRALLAQAQASTGAGITATIRQGLELLAASHAYAQLRKLRGKVKLPLNLRTLREDRPVGTGMLRGSKT